MSTAVRSAPYPSTDLSAARTRRGPAKPRRRTAALKHHRQDVASRRSSAFLSGVSLFSTRVAVVAIASALPFYGWHVSTQRQWGKSYIEIQQLQRQERRLISQNEAQKHQVTDKAEQQSSGFVPVGPKNSLFVPEMASRPAVQSPKTVAPALPVELDAPLAY